MTELCTRCKRDAPIRIRETIGGVPGWDLPVQLCGVCWDHYNNLDDEASAKFAQDLWCSAAVQSLTPIGNS